jgi:hypothetical protein
MQTRGYVTEAQTRQAFREICRQDPEVNSRAALLRVFEDELRPLDTRGRWRPSRLLILIAGILAGTIIVFTLFTFGARS